MTLRIGSTTLVFYRQATVRWGWVWNRYPIERTHYYRTIGAALAMGRYCASLQWRRAP